MDKKPKRKIDKIIVALILVSLVGIAEAVVIGSIIISSNSQIATINADIRSEEARREAINQLTTRFSEVENEGIVTEINDLLPSADNFLDVLVDIEESANRAGVILVISLGDARLTTEGFELPNELRNQSIIGRTLPPDANYDFLEVDLTVRGEYDEVQQFMNYFDQSKYYMNLTSVTINRISLTENSFIDASFTAEIFVQQVVFNG